MSQEQIKNYLYQLQQSHPTPCESYFKHTVFGLRALFKVENLNADHIQLPVIKRSNKLPVVLSKPEMKRLLLAPDLLKHRILIGLLYGCGLRCMEARNVQLNDLDFERAMLHVRQGKGAKDRYVPLSQHLIRGLKAYINKKNLNNGSSTDNRKVVQEHPFGEVTLMGDTVSEEYNGQLVKPLARLEPPFGASLRTSAPIRLDTRMQPIYLKTAWIF